MNPCDRCKRPLDLKCCHNCKKDAASCDVWHKCGEDCKEWKAQIQTNADRIRAMSDEELAEFICEWCNCVPGYCPGVELCTPSMGKANGLVKWLKQPAEVDNG